MLRALQCPSCAGPLQPPGRFARETTCPFCGTRVVLDPARVYAARFREAHATWEEDIPALTLAGSRWALGPLVGRGTVADVYRVRRPRFPTERGLLKVLRDPRDLPVLRREWDTVSAIATGEAPGAPTYAGRLPEPVATGTVSAGPFADRPASVYRATPGFRVPLGRVPGSRPRLPQASIWVWRRVLEVLTFLHRAGFAHGNVHADHVILQDAEHGLRLVGLGNAARLGAPRLVHDLSPGGTVPAADTLSARHDVMASARMIVALLGGDLVTASVPGLPSPYAVLLHAAAHGELADAWAVRESLGRAAAAFGPPAFLPLVHDNPELPHG